MSIDWQMKRRKLDELLTVDKLTGWLGKQDPGGEYVYSDPVFCLMGRYLADNDIEWGAGAYSELPGYYAIAAEKPWNFGAALQRAQGVQEALKALPPPALQIEGQATEILDLERVHELGRGSDQDQIQPEQRRLGGPAQAEVG